MTVLYPWFNDEFNKLSKLITSNRFPHALLISSSGGLGVENLTFHISKLLLCHNVLENNENFNACGNCKSCLLFDAGTHPDIRNVQPEEFRKPIKVDQIRAVSSFIQQTGQQGRNKVVVINPADQLNLQAANAVLKSLEEPPAGTFLILVTERPASLLPTIRSRCVKLTLGVPDLKVEKNWLSQHIDDPERAELLLGICAGKPCEAVYLNKSDGMEVRNQLHAELEQLLSLKLSSIEIAAKWKKLPIHTVMHWLALWCTDICRYLGSKGVADIRDPIMLKITKYTVKKANPDSIFALTDYILEAKGGFDNQANLNQQLVLEEILIKWHDIIS